MFPVFTIAGVEFPATTNLSGSSARSPPSRRVYWVGMMKWLLENALSRSHSSSECASPRWAFSRHWDLDGSSPLDKLALRLPIRQVHPLPINWRLSSRHRRPREGQLDQNAMYPYAVEIGYQSGKLLLTRPGRKRTLHGMKPALLCHSALRCDVGMACGIIAQNHHGQARLDTGLRRERKSDRYPRRRPLPPPQVL